MKKPKPYDQAFKYLAEQDPHALLVMLRILKPGQKARIKLLPNEVTVSAKLPDSTYLVTLETGEQRIVHIEAQTVYDPQIQRRMAEYAIRLWIKYGLPVDSYLVLLTPRKAPTPIPHGQAGWTCACIIKWCRFGSSPRGRHSSWENEICCPSFH